MNRKLGRKVTIEIYEDNYHTQTQESTSYKTDLKGDPIVDIFKDCKKLSDVRDVLLLTKKGRDIIKTSFSEADFILVKINKRGLSFKQMIEKYEFENCIVKG